MIKNKFKPSGPAWESAEGICEDPHVAWFSKGDTILVMAEGFDGPLKMRVWEVGSVVLAKRTIKGVQFFFMGCPSGLLCNKIDSTKPWMLLDKIEKNQA